MYVSAIVLAAGKGLRFSRPDRRGIPRRYVGRNPKIPKPLIKINSKPVIIYSLNTLSKHPAVKDIIVVVNALNQKDIVRKIRQYAITKVRQIVLGGKERQDSVRNGLKAMDSSTDLVLIHDAVRPFIMKGGISSVIKEAQNCGAAILGVPVKATIKSVASCQSSVVSKTLNRENLWEIQTPQVFRKDLILEAYKRFGDREVTDDAALVEKLGAKVKLVRGSYFNLKITTPEDLVIAEAIVKRLR
ncbi:MAG: 2-C-methyl-D-erythritol 4-phosphate cytidylyltransferase [Candidatus Omnitrophica bacterium CG08_land_8_20_14_0_20_41_16]|uniref:2-C-methyl-D-erythritol 4-phosphate cytidylyltransferase n=1 Tax=Candidatus Sherwoodlollariibacterium unditelluris TaxID=1974757 RepID=A0A2G9YJ96_9BACT|nr:MAG: 2-C-methyl-D-erythritol 4-phosphate cytidylyltransferase [Candidatus Omnitrophica bacterium CG23_combo_of_CG06-09_8_20_14_all_41_10]PIS34406.1 MAG: 2-C-methyl-D-erythritol 4-phosphate cytidylyltransferase [Candidatus Omnitrophica bacterium CG08_land_8_20_14_0_20_41_16]